MRTFQDAQKETDTLYKSLVQIADDIIKKHTQDIDKTIKNLENNIENVSNEELRKYTLKLATMAYTLGDKVEHADFKRDCANAILKETTAREFSLASGPVAAKQTTATLNTAQESAVNLLYDMVANSLKTKLQMINRIIDSIKNVLISRTAEAKIENQLGFGTKEKEETY